MFATFKGFTTSTSGSEETPRSTKRKRTQVDRACDRCRLSRVKCDVQRPCRNCQSVGRQCSNGGSREGLNLSEANREIERLRTKVAELEGRLRESQPTTALPLSPPDSEATPVALAKQEHKRSSQKGAWISDPNGRQDQYYGSLSSVYFVHRLQTWVRQTFPHGSVPDLLQLNTASTTCSIPASLSLQKSALLQQSTKSDDSSAGQNLNKHQEDCFLNLFYQSNYLLTPVIDQSEFREYRDSLWNSTLQGSEESRLPSALVDISVALGMQYGNYLIAVVDEPLESSSNDSSTTGHWLYRRCEMLLSHEREYPSISTVQAQIYCTVYLLNASLMNMASTILAETIRVAHMLGLNRTPPDGTPLSRRNLQRRIWWNLVFLDSKMSMRLGLPFLIDPSDVAFGLPTEEEDTAAMGDTDLFTYKDVNLLTYHALSVKLILAARGVYDVLNEKYMEVTGNNGGRDIYENPSFLEECARALPQAMKSLQKWTLEVPDALKNRRKGVGEPFTTIRGSLEIDYSAPIWLQRQRLLLELLYHNLVMSLHRPFIRFYPGTSFLTPVAAAFSNSAINHAAITIEIVSQVLSETDILNSWHQVYQYTWDAALSSIGFGLAHPICPFTPTARRSINKAISCFDLFDAQHVAAAKSAADSARSFNSMLDTLAANLRDIKPSADSRSGPFAQDTPLTDPSLPSTSPPQPGALAAQTPVGERSDGMLDMFSTGTTVTNTLTLGFLGDMFSVFDDEEWLRDTGIEGLSNNWPD